jgi:hypothetical protein
MEGNNGRPTGFINNLVDTFGRVIAWGVMLIVMITIVSAIGIGMLRSKVKNAIDYIMASAVDYAMSAVLEDPEFTQKIRVNTKEAIEYSLQKVKNEALNDAALNQKIKTNTKEAVEYLIDKVKQEAMTDGKFIEKVKTNIKEGVEYTVHQVDEHF